MYSVGESPGDSLTANDITGNTLLCLSHLTSINQSVAWPLGHSHHVFTISHVTLPASFPHLPADSQHYLMCFTPTHTLHDKSISYYSLDYRRIGHTPNSTLDEHLPRSDRYIAFSHQFSFGTCSQPCIYFCINPFVFFPLADGCTQFQMFP